MRRLLCLLLLFFGLAIHAEDYAAHLTPLIDPANLSTLGTRGANPRIHKCVYWLDTARKAGQAPDKVVDEAVARAGYTNASATLTKAALLRNLDIAEKLGCLNDFGLAEMRQGRSPANPACTPSRPTTASARATGDQHGNQLIRI
jgi:hypothetical protein